MTGKGTSEVAFAPEVEPFGDLVDDDSDSTPEYYQPGRDVTVESGPELSNELEDLDLPDQAESVESVAGRMVGSFEVSWKTAADRVDDVQSIIFNSGGTSFAGGQAVTSTWFFGLDYISGTAERAVSGVIPQSYTVSYDDESNTIEESLSCAYADETFNTPITPTSIQSAGEGQTVPFHGSSLDINTVAQTMLSSAELTISDIARYQWGASRHPLGAVIDAPSTELSVSAIFSEKDQLEAAYGGDGTTTPQDQLDSVTAVLGFSVAGATATEYTLSAGKPGTYSWENLTSSDDTEESITLSINGTEVTA